MPFLYRQNGSDTSRKVVFRNVKIESLLHFSSSYIPGLLVFDVEVPADQGLFVLSLRRNGVAITS